MDTAPRPAESAFAASPLALHHRLSPQDAQFYYLESDQAPMNIGSVAIFEGAIPYEPFVRNIESKLHLIPRYGQRVVEAPFNLSRPTWESVPDFDITEQIRRLRLPPPGSDEQLTDLAGSLFRGRLDRRRPLWEMHFVEGLQGDRTALISRVHHCLVDGVGGVELLMVTLDVSPEPSAAPSAPPVRDPAPEPARRQLMAEAFFDTLSERVDQWAAVANWLIDLGSAQTEGTRLALKALGTTLGYIRQPAQKLPFNQAFSGKRRFAFLEMPFQDVRALRSGGATVNDVVLTILAGGLARYVELHGEAVEGREVRVLVPVNVRQESERGMLGNRISMLLVELPLGLRDPVERLHVISERMEALKRDRTAEGVSAVGNVLGSLPGGLMAAMGTMPGLPNTLANLVCTNVPGPMIPLYTVGHKMLAHYPIVPIAWEMGIGCAVMSYNHKLYFGLAGDGKAGADVERLKAFVEESYVELRSATGLSDEKRLTPVTAAADKPGKADSFAA